MQQPNCSCHGHTERDQVHGAKRDILEVILKPLASPVLALGVLGLQLLTGLSARNLPRLGLGAVVGCYIKGGFLGWGNRNLPLWATLSRPVQRRAPRGGDNVLESSLSGSWN